MMFATLDDLEGSVELLVFGKALAAGEDALTPDSVVMVRGRVDHKDREKTCLVVQQIERFEPTAEEVQQADQEEAKRANKPGCLRLRLTASALGDGVLSELREVLEGFPGESEVVIELSTSKGQRKLRLGPDFRVSHSAALHAELAELLGPALMRGAGAAGAAPNGAGPEEPEPTSAAPGELDRTSAAPEEPDPTSAEPAAAASA